VKKVKNLINGEIKFFEFVELKWRGVKTESVSIPPKSMRKLDAAYIKHAKPNIAVLGINRFLVDWGGYLEDYKIQGVGDYEIDYVVFSDNFAPAEATYKLHIAKNLQETKVERILNSHSK
jgi:hypothetical protein